MQRGRPKTKPLTVFKILEPKFKVRLDRNTTVYVRSLDIVKEVWRPLYPDLKVSKVDASMRMGTPDSRSAKVERREKARTAKNLARPRQLKVG